MGRYFVQQQDWRHATSLGDQLCMGQHQPQQQSLLLTGRATCCLLILGYVRDREILAMRSLGCSPGRGVTAPVGPERSSEFVAIPPFTGQ